MTRQARSGFQPPCTLEPLREGENNPDTRVLPQVSEVRPSKRWSPDTVFTQGFSGDSVCWEPKVWEDSEEDSSRRPARMTKEKDRRRQCGNQAKGGQSAVRQQHRSRTCEDLEMPTGSSTKGQQATQESGVNGHCGQKPPEGAPRITGGQAGHTSPQEVWGWRGGGHTGNVTEGLELKKAFFL